MSQLTGHGINYIALPGALNAIGPAERRTAPRRARRLRPLAGWPGARRRAPLLSVGGGGETHLVDAAQLLARWG